MEMSSEGLSCVDVSALGASELTSLLALPLKPEQEVAMACMS